jgi:CHAT domain
LHAGLYPDLPGSNQVFGNLRKNPDNPFEMARPAAAIVIGLGEEGKLRSVDLAFAVRQGVLTYAQRLSEQPGGTAAHFDLAATLIGSGGTGVTAGSSAQAIAQGASEANIKLQETGWPQIGRLMLVELYLERAADAWRALSQQQLATPNRIKLVGKIDCGQGALRLSLDSSYRGTSYDFISVLTAADPSGNACIEFKLDTKRARTEVRAQRAQASLLRAMVGEASNSANADPLIGRTLFNLLVPAEVEPFLGGATEMVIEVDRGTAAIPWELLDTSVDEDASDPMPWAIRSKLIRKLQTEEFRAVVIDASADDSVLVIGAPLSDPTLYPPLEGARIEAIAVAQRLTQAGSGVAASKVHAFVDHDDAQTIINALFERPYRAVHIAGHGAPGANGGVILSGQDTFLGANEVRAMRSVPELVFLNCCHLAARDAQSTLAPFDRAAFAANIAEELIRCGVRCVIAAGWAVEDDAAEKFATAFYAALLGGARFMEAVGAARTAAWNANRDGNTWAAYQCYGDPEWSWRRGVGDAQRPSIAPSDEFSGVASPPALAIALETLAVESEFNGVPSERLLDKLRYLESEFASLWGGMGAVAEAFGLAYANANAIDQAIAWYRVAVDAEDGSASLRAGEQLGALLARHGDENDDPQSIRVGIDRLERMSSLQKSIERENLIGSACKRLAMLETRAGRSKAAQDALDAAIEHYAIAEQMTRKSGALDLFEPIKNVIGCEIRNALLKKRAPHIDHERMKDAGISIRQMAIDKPDFRSVAGQSELLILDALSQQRLARAEPGISASFRDLKRQVAAPANWNAILIEAEFTLLPYLDFASGAEKRAAQALLALLATLAQMAKV